MFTGIIEELGEVLRWEPNAGAARLTVRGPLAVSDAKHGDSIAVSGVCLTVVDQGPDWFTADVMAETIAMSTLASLAPGSRVNLERSAQVGDRLGGHIVQGHIDGTSRVISVTEGSAWRVLRFSLDRQHARLVAGKGSIAVDGVSLTVSAVSGPAGDGAVGGVSTGSTTRNGSTTGAGDYWFEVSLIPETLAVTTLGLKKPGDLANIETDIVARHVERLLAFGGATASATGTADSRSSTSWAGSTSSTFATSTSHASATPTRSSPTSTPRVVTAPASEPIAFSATSDSPNAFITHIATGRSEL
jgi:riboflavin synthase